MNDFTKEELMTMEYAVDVCISEDGSDDDLMKKLNSMINNYCDHENKIECADCGVVRCGRCEEETMNDLKVGDIIWRFEDDYDNGMLDISALKLTYRTILKIEDDIVLTDANKFWENLLWIDKNFYRTRTEAVNDLMAFAQWMYEDDED